MTAAAFLPDTTSADTILDLTVSHPDAVHIAVREETGITLPHSATQAVAALSWLVASMTADQLRGLAEKITARI